MEKLNMQDFFYLEDNDSLENALRETATKINEIIEKLEGNPVAQDQFTAEHLYEVSADLGWSEEEYLLFLKALIKARTTDKVQPETVDDTV